MKSLINMDFSIARCWATRWSWLAVSIAGLILAWVMIEWRGVSQLESAIEHMQIRIDQHKLVVERERLRQKKLSPEQRRLERVLAEQKMAEAGSGMPMIDWIEQAWEPWIALLSIVIDKAGKEARIEGASFDLAHIYTFADALKKRYPDRQIGLQRHHIKVVDGKTFYQFSLRVRQL